MVGCHFWAPCNGGCYCWAWCHGGVPLLNDIGAMWGCHGGVLLLGAMVGAIAGWHDDVAWWGGRDGELNHGRGRSGYVQEWHQDDA